VAAIHRLANDIDWQGKNIDQIVASIPARSRVAAIHSLLNRRGALVTAIENARLAVQEAPDNI
jgi:hypothetical protein